LLATGAGVSALAIGAGGIVAALDRDPQRGIVTDEPSTTTTATTSPVEPPGDVYLHVSPPSAAPGPVTIVLLNVGAEAVPVCGGEAELQRYDGGDWVPEARLVGDEAYAPGDGPVFDCDPEYVLPGNFSHEWTVSVPDVEGTEYRFVYQGVASQVVPAGSRIFRHLVTDYVVEVAPELEADGDVLPDELVVLGGNRVAIAWTSACNRPAREIVFSYDQRSVAVHLQTGSFLVIDCLGEPDRWATVVDLPAPLDGRPVVSYVRDAGPGADPAVLEATRADAWPRGEPLPVLASMVRRPLSLLGITATGGWIALRPYDGCGAWVARPVRDETTFYVQAFGDPDTPDCSDNPTPQLGFTVAEDDPFEVFGAAP
jgi:hypothetical protein